MVQPVSFSTCGHVCVTITQCKIQRVCTTRGLTFAASVQGPSVYMFQVLKFSICNRYCAGKCKKSFWGVCMVDGGCPALQCFSKTLWCKHSHRSWLQATNSLASGSKKNSEKNEQFGSDESEQADREGGSKRASPVVYPVQPSGLQERVSHVLLAPLLGNNCSQDFEWSPNSFICTNGPRVIKMSKPS